MNSHSNARCDGKRRRLMSAFFYKMLAVVIFTATYTYRSSNNLKDLFDGFNNEETHGHLRRNYEQQKEAGSDGNIIVLDHGNGNDHRAMKMENNDSPQQEEDGSMKSSPNADVVVVDPDNDSDAMKMEINDSQQEEDGSMKSSPNADVVGVDPDNDSDAMKMEINDSQQEEDGSMQSNLRVIITGMEHSGTTITGRIVTNAPCIMGATETGFLLADSPRDISNVNPWFDWNIDDGNDREKKRMMYLLKPDDVKLMERARDFAEMYNILRHKSHLFNDLNEKYDDGRECGKPSQVVDKTPRYVHPRFFQKIIKKTPGVPIIVVKKPYEKMRTRKTKEYYNLVYDNVNDLKKKFPKRIFMIHYDELMEDPNKVMEGAFEFLGLPWKQDYLKMTGLKQKFSNYPNVVEQIANWEFQADKHSPGGTTKFH